MNDGDGEFLTKAKAWAVNRGNGEMSQAKKNTESQPATNVRVNRLPLIFPLLEYLIGMYASIFKISPHPAI